MKPIHQVCYDRLIGIHVNPQPSLEIVKGPHRLWVGANGRKTYGITVRATGSKDEVELKGHQRQFDVNDYMIARMTAQSLADQLGLTLEEAEAIQLDTGRLVETQADALPEPSYIVTAPGENVIDRVRAEQ